MNIQQIEVHEHYQALHPEALVLYHLPGQYILLGNDVKRALESIPNLQIISEGVAALPDEFYYLSTLSETGAEVCLVQYRNDNGVLDWPDVKRLREENVTDY